jgi:hypothetical protein
MWWGSVWSPSTTCSWPCPGARRTGPRPSTRDSWASSAWRSPSPWRCWFSNGSVVVHLGVEDDFRPAKKAHPAFAVDGFDALVDALGAAGVANRPDTDLPGVRRCYVDDPFGNRNELIEH